MIREFFKLESAGGIILMLASALAILIANSPLAGYYADFLHLHLAVQVGTLKLDKPLHHWINDGLMAVFFLLVGLEIKREFLQGELASRQQALLPFIGAAGGMAVPAAIYVGINAGHESYLNGWAIPAATDIAFAIAVVALLGRRVPVSLKVFLTAVAIIDDLGSIIIIAVFYTSQLSLLSLALAGLALAGLVLLNLFNVNRLAPYVVIGVLLWICVLQSGVHATLAGVALAMAMPLRDPAGGEPMLTRCEHGLHPWVAFGILPLFGFANAGVSFEGIGWHSVTDQLTLGIALGLLIGKQVGVFTAVWLSVKSGLARMPENASWAQIYGVTVICGIGFTMSLFIGTIAWDHTLYDAQIRLGVILGSLSSAALGIVVLRLASIGRAPASDPTDTP